MRKLIYAIAVVFCCGCGDFLKEYSQDLVTVKTVEDFDEVLLGSGYIPSEEVSYFNTNSRYCSWLNLLDDDLNTAAMKRSPRVDTRNLRNAYGYTTWQLEAGMNIEGNNKTEDDATWNNFYERINMTNVILTEIDKMNFALEGEKLKVLRIKGECLFIRAQCYLTLVNLYANAYVPATAAQMAGVPLKLTGYVEQDNSKTSQFERTPVAEVYAQIVKDLQASINYLTQSPQKAVTYRASKEAATLLLSRVYLYMQQWENAKKAANDFLSMKDELGTISASYLTENCPEVVFSQGSLNISNVLSGKAGDFSVSKELYNLYDTTDSRKAGFFTMEDSIGLQKYRMAAHRSHVSDLFTLRVAEAYLNLAEACAMTEDASDDAKGCDRLNQLRKNRIRDYLPQSYSGEQLLQEVRLERRKELCFEGQRWFDLRRYAVCEKFPFKKEIFRFYTYYNDQSRYVQTWYFILAKDDLAYTFRIPAKVIEFDKTMKNNDRNKRELYVVKTINIKD